MWLGNTSSETMKNDNEKLKNEKFSNFQGYIYLGGTTSNLKHKIWQFM